MSQVTLQEAKRYLRVMHSLDDALIQELIDGAEQEACRFLNRSELPTLPLEYPSESSSEEVPSSEDPVTPDVRVGVLLLVKADYEATTPDEVEGYRKAAECKFMPYRTEMGL